MKRLISVLLVVSLLGCLLVSTGNASGTLASEGWTSDGKNLTGWSMKGQTITGDFNKMTNKRIWKDCLTDMRNFRIEMDIVGSNISSPYIQIMGVVLELDGNHGNGDQVFVKLAGKMIDWMAAKGTKVHVCIERSKGGDLKYTLTGAGENKSLVYTATPVKGESNVEIGLYRGGSITIDGFRVEITGDGSDQGPAVDSNLNVVPLTVGEHFEFLGNGQWREQTDWTFGVNGQEGIWIQSSEKDGADAKAVYMTEKLSEQWYASMTFRPVSTANNGRTVCRMILMDSQRGSVVLLTMEHLAADKKVKFTWQTANGTGWDDIWKDSDWVVAEDEAFTVTLQKQSDTEIALSITGDSGYRKTVTKTINTAVMERISRVGASTERSAVRITNVVVTAKTEQRDYTALAKQTFDNLVKNYVDKTNNRISPVRWGFKNGDLTNTGQTVSVSGVGEVWESTVMMMAMDTYAHTLEKGSEEWKTVAQIIANTVNMLISGYTEKQLTTAAAAPNYAMDDCAWNVMCYILGYAYNRDLGKTAASARCLKLAKGLFNNSYETFYSTDLGGLSYTAAKQDVSLYGATMAVAGYYLNVIEPDTTIEKRYLDIYNGLENVLRRPDGIYWCGASKAGADGAGNPYGIGEAGSVSYLAGNMGMAVLNALMGNTDKAEQTVLGIVRYETYANGAYLNDRDAWNNTFFLGMFVREVIQKGIASDVAQRALDATVSAVLENACFDDGYYSAAWLGPREPSSLGYPSQGEYTTDGRNNWGKGYNNNGLNIGSTPNQIMTTATTAHVLLAGALSASYEKDVPTEPADPVDPTEPMDPTEPETPTEPIAPNEPTEPTAPADPTEPSAPAAPTEPDGSEGTVPEEPTVPSDPTQPAEGTEPSAPAEGPEPTEDPGEPQPNGSGLSQEGILWMVLMGVTVAAVVAIVIAWKKK